MTYLHSLSTGMVSLTSSGAMALSRYGAAHLSTTAAGSSCPRESLQTMPSGPAKDAPIAWLRIMATVMHLDQISWRSLAMQPVMLACHPKMTKLAFSGDAVTRGGRAGMLCPATGSDIPTLQAHRGRDDQPDGIYGHAAAWGRAAWPPSTGGFGQFQQDGVLHGGRAHVRQRERIVLLRRQRAAGSAAPSCDGHRGLEEDVRGMRSSWIFCPATLRCPPHELSTSEPASAAHSCSPMIAGQQASVRACACPP